MNNVSQVISIWDNGEEWPLRAPVFFEIKERGATKVIAHKWNFQQKQYELRSAERGYASLDLLPDATGFIAIDGAPGKHAYILNGDGSIRFVLEPLFNVRGLSPDQIDQVERLKKEDLAPNDGEGCTLFHYVSNNTNKLEIFGDDGFGDCYYTYDWDTGKLLSARALPYRT